MDLCSKKVCTINIVIAYESVCNHSVVTVVLYNTGFVSNGEYNTFRLKGYTRPLSVLQIQYKFDSK